MEDILIVKRILSNDVFKKYQKKDKNLGILIKDLRKNPENWETSQNVTLSKRKTSAIQMNNIWSVRLNLLESDTYTRNLDQNVIEEMKETFGEIVSFCQFNPHATIRMLVLHTDIHSYHVFFCTDHLSNSSQVKVITVIRDKPIIGNLV
jgi:uroporphyrinogen-III decarboxylase